MSEQEKKQGEIPNQHLADRIAGKVDLHGNKIIQEEAGAIASEQKPENNEEQKSENADTKNAESGSVTSESNEDKEDVATEEPSVVHGPQDMDERPSAESTDTENFKIGSVASENQEVSGNVVEEGPSAETLAHEKVAEGTYAEDEN